MTARLARLFTPVGYRRNGRPIFPIAGGALTRLEEIDFRLEVIRSEILEIQELPEPTDEDITRTDALLDERDTLTTEREPLAVRAERLEAVRSAAANPAHLERPAGPRGPEVITRTDPFENLEALRYTAPDDQAVVARAVTALTDYRPRGVSDEQLETAVRNVETISGAAQHALMHGSPAYRSAFNTYMRAHGENPLYSPEEAEAVRAALSLTGANGGYTLPTLLDPTLIHTGTATKNPLRRLSRVVTGTQKTWHGVSVGNVATYWKAEGSAMTEGAPTFANPSVDAQMLTAYLTASYEIFEDSNLQSQLPGLIAEAFDYKEGTAFVVGAGSGSNEPKGIVTAISATAASTVTATTRGAFTSASSVDVFALLGALPSRYEDSAEWVANKAWFNIVRQMSTGSQGSLFWTDLNSSIPPSLLGSGIAQSSDMNTSFASGSVIAILGDWSQFVIYDRIGTSVEFMQNVVDGSGLPTGQRGLVAHKRVGSDVTDLNAFRFLKA